MKRYTTLLGPVLAAGLLTLTPVAPAQAKSRPCGTTVRQFGE
jgi:hypothetical protein